MCVNFHPAIIALLGRMNRTTLKDRTEELRDGRVEQQHAEAIVSIAGREMPEMGRTDLAFQSFHVGMLMWQTENELRSDLFLKKLLIRQSAPEVFQS